MQNNHYPQQATVRLRQQRYKYLLVIGFSTTLLLFGILTGVAIQQVQHTYGRIQAIVEDHNYKGTLVTRMLAAARERSIDLFTMVGMPDPFDRDEIFLRFNAHGAAFAQARIQLLSIPLSDKEHELLKEQGRLTGIAVPLQNQAVELIQQDRIAEANQLLLTQTVPEQNKVLKLLRELQILEQNASVQTAALAKQEQLNTIRTILILGGLALLLSIGIAILVIRSVIRADTRLFLEKELAEITLHSIGDAAITTNARGRIRTINPVAEKLTGWTHTSAAGEKLSQVLNTRMEPGHAPAADLVREAITQRRPSHSSGNIILQRPDGHEFAIELTAAPILDQEGEVRGAIVIFRDVTEIRTLAKQLSYQASHDALTGLINRREFEIRLAQALTNTRAEHQHYALCYLDLDQFKVINDTCGHAAGDEMLKQLSVRLKAKLRESDLLARLGGDEFGILLEGCNLDKAEDIANGLCNSIRDMRFIWDDKSFEIGVSIGLVPINPYSGNVSDVLSAADTACYEAKDQGRNRVHVYRPTDTKLTKRRDEMQWVHRINQALETDNLLLYCQDIVPLKNPESRPQYYEILVRLQDEEGKLVPPMAFIPAAERYNLMPLIDKKVIHMALHALRDINNVTAERPINITLNISGQSLTDTDLLEFIVNSIEKTGVAAEQLTFEITETAAIANFSLAVHLIKTLKSLGCRFALDDFGSGLSSFTYLKNMPVDFIKIDGSFIRYVIDDPTDLAFVESIQQIGEIMGIQTIGEYVEDSAIMKKLGEIGIDYAQGFHICKPKPLSELFNEYSTNQPVRAR